MGGGERGRQLLLSSTMLAAALASYGRRAYGQCVPDPVAPDFTCSNANVTQQTINADNATVVTAPGFSVNTGDKYGVIISGNGALSFTDVNFSPLTGNYEGLLIDANGDDGGTPGSITVNTNGALTGGGSGIIGDSFGTSGSTGAMTITTNGQVTGIGADGIGAYHYGNGPLTITTNGDVTGARGGIFALNRGSGATNIVTNGNVFGGTFVGIFVEGSGAINIVTNGNVTGDGSGIDAVAFGGGPLNIVTNGTVVGGTYDGIGANNVGNGALTITVTGNVTGAQDGIDAQTNGGGPIVITVGATSTVTSTGAAANESAIEASSGPANVTVFGTVNGGGNAIEFEPGAPFDDRLELHPTATINGDVLGGPGTDTLALDGPGQGAFNVSQLVDFEIGEVNGGIWTLTGATATSFTVDGGTLMGTATFGGLNVNNGGTVAPGNSIGTMTVNGPFTLAAGAVYEVEANAAGKSDKVIVKGTVNLTGATLRVLAANGNYKPKTDYTIIDNDGTDAVKGTFAKVTSNLAFLTPLVFYNGGDGNDVVLTLLNTAADLCSVAETRNQCNVARALNRFPSDNPLLLAVLNQTASGARTAFDALSGEVHATVAGTLSDDSRYVREAVLGRLMQANHTGEALSAGGPQVASLETQAYALGYDGKSQIDEPERAPLAFWTRAFGAWGDFDTDGNAASADRDLGGFISGMDADIGSGWRAGLATGASFSNVDVEDRYSSADVETYHLGGYIGGMAGSFALRGGGMWAWNDIDTSRAVVFPGFYERQKASYDADTGQLFGEVAYPTQMGGIALEPFGGLAFVSVDTDSFRENGGPQASLRGRNLDQDVGYTTLGLRAATTMMWGATQVTPHISAAWLHAFDDVTPGASLAFATTGIGFAINGVPLADDSALLDAGLDFALSDRMTAGVSYTGQYSDNVTDNGIKGRFTWLF